MKLDFKKLLTQVIILLVGLTIAHFGVTLFILADLGSDPFNVLVQGVYRALDGLLGWEFLTHGRIHIGLCLLIVLALLPIDRSYIRIGTLLCMVCGGPIIDVFTVLLTPLFALTDAFWFKLAMLALGCVILAFGMTIVIKSKAGTGPNDLVAVIISDKSGGKFGLIRILTDATFVLVGFLLGGSVGIGTIVCAACVGPVAGWFMPFNESWIRRLMEKSGCEY